MKYMFLVHVSPDAFDAPKAREAAAAGRACAEALEAAGVFIAGAGLQSPENTTTVSVRDGKRQVQDGP
ncbi:MAG: YciI family protein [Opitutaceae bacterium]